MSAIVVNTLTGAVSEYDGFDFQSITPTQAGSVLGLFDLGGDRDGTAPIVARVSTGETLIGDSRKKTVRDVYFSITGEGEGELTITGKSGSYSYSFPVRAQGESRAVPGRGIRENYLSFTYSNPAGDAFLLDRMEVNFNTAADRRVG